MLDEARKRVKEYGWKNVELVLSDVAEYNVPNDVDGIIGLGALTYSPEYDQVTKNGFEGLKPGKRFVIFDTKKSERPVRIFAPILLQLLYYTSTNIPIEFYCSAQRIEGGA